MPDTGQNESKRAACRGDPLFAILVLLTLLGPGPLNDPDPLTASLTPRAPLRVPRTGSGAAVSPSDQERLTVARGDSGLGFPTLTGLPVSETSGP